MTTTSLTPKINKKSGDVRPEKTKKSKRKSPESDEEVLVESNVKEISSPKKKKAKKEKKAKQAESEPDSPEEESSDQIIVAEKVPGTGMLSEEEFTKTFDIRVKGLSLPKCAQTFECVAFLLV
mmetsp:Transcript_13723/g.18849  ORF Transcript_13723/g.18849 Transcript_13723/m.18849 type:complete len:123 (-) Transcript_13723:4-372(-)